MDKAGLVVPIVVMLLLCVISALASTMLAEAIALVEGNGDFKERLEYATVVRYYFGTKACSAIQLLYVVSVEMFIIANILVTAQMMDELLCFMFGQTFALEFLPKFQLIESTSSLFPGATILLSLGYIFSMVIFIPMSLLNLDEVLF